MAQRVVLTNFGSYGDLHPFIAIGLKLKAQGFDAVIAASEIYRAKVETAGLESSLPAPVWPTSRPTPGSIPAARSGGWPVTA